MTKLEPADGNSRLRQYAAPGSIGLPASHHAPLVEIHSKKKKKKNTSRLEQDLSTISKKNHWSKGIRRTVVLSVGLRTKVLSRLETTIYARCVKFFAVCVSAARAKPHAEQKTPTTKRQDLRYAIIDGRSRTRYFFKALRARYIGGEGVCFMVSARPLPASK